MEDCKRMGVEVIPPDVNSSDADFSVVAGRIPFGLSAIKACGSGAADAIVAARKLGGPFRSLFDFCERVDRRRATGRRSKSLIKAGAFDSLGAKRAQLMAVIERAMQSGASAAADRRSGQRGLFGDEEETHDRRVDRASQRARVPGEGTAGDGEGSARLLSHEPSARRAREHAPHLLLAHVGAAGEAGTSHGSAARRDAGRDQVFAHQEPAARQHQHQVRDVGPRRPRRHHALHHVAGAVRRVRRSW